MFLSFQMAHYKHKGVTLHAFFHLLPTKESRQPNKFLIIEECKTHSTLKKVKIKLHDILALEQKRSKWSMVSSSTFTLGPMGYGCRLLRMMLQNGSLLDCSRNDAKDPLGKEMVIRAEELESSKGLGFGCVSMREEHNLDNLPTCFLISETSWECLLR